MRISLLILPLVAFSAAPASARMASCHLRYSASGWSAIYQRSSGRGRVTCSNGQAASVAIRLEGAGFIAGKTRIDAGTGRFSEVADISELFGDYARAEATAAAVKAGEAQVLTKGPVSLALAGKGRGWELGVAAGKFTITRVAGQKRRTGTARTTTPASRATTTTAP